MRQVNERKGESNADEHTFMERFGVFYTDIICGRKEKKEKKKLGRIGTYKIHVWAA
jgi:hypothetical protein